MITTSTVRLPRWRRPLFCMFVCWCAGVSAVAQEPARGPDKTDELVQKAVARLAAVGCAVPTGIRAERRSAAQVIADLDEQQDLFLPEAAYPVLRAVRHGLGLHTGRDGEALRQQAIASTARGLSAYYDPLRKTFVLLSTASRDTMEALAGSVLPLVVHELVHAHQDARERGLAGLFRNDGRTIDSAHARRCVVEGEAEIVAVLALQGEAGLEQLAKKSSASALGKLFAGEFTGTIYEVGRQLALHRHREGKAEALLALWRSPPPSTEQVLHLGKLGKDVPTTVVVPEIEGLARRHATTLGELVLYDLLRQLGSDEKVAGVAAAGWDGDQAVALQDGEDGPEAVVWRSVWDRDADAADFAKVLAASTHGTVVHEGRVVDWFATDADAWRERIAAALAKSRPQPPRSESDEASTVAAEAEFVDGLPQMFAEQGFWQHPQLGLTIPIPEGWEIRDVNGVKLLVEPKAAGAVVATNVNVHVAARGPIADDEALLATNEKQLEQTAGIEVDSMELVRFGQQRVVLGEYHGRFGRMPPMHFLVIVYLRGEQQIVVTATTTEKRWPAQEAMLRALVRGVKITPP